MLVSVEDIGDHLVASYSELWSFGSLTGELGAQRLP
jgi:hypothetical protein